MSELFFALLRNEGGGATATPPDLVIPLSMRTTQYWMLSIQFPAYFMLLKFPEPLGSDYTTNMNSAR